MGKRGPLKGLEVEFAREVPVSKKYLNDKGQEIPDPMPIEPPIGYKRAPTLAEQIKAMVRGEQLAHAAKTSGNETFEEADDFNVEDDFDPQSPYEEVFDPPPTWDDQSVRLGELIEHGKERYLERKRLAEEKKKKKEAPAEPEPPEPQGEENQT